MNEKHAGDAAAVVEILLAEESKQLDNFKCQSSIKNIEEKLPVAHGNIIIKHVENFHVHYVKE